MEGGRWNDDTLSTLQSRCYKAFVSNGVQDSDFQGLGLLPEEEVLVPSGYRIDALVEVGGQDIGVEVDRPTHFIDRALAGKPIIKRTTASYDH